MLEREYDYFSREQLEQLNKIEPRGITSTNLKYSAEFERMRPRETSTLPIETPEDVRDKFIGVEVHSDSSLYIGKFKKMVCVDSWESSDL